MPDVPDGLLEVGRIGRPHGVRGDLMVTLTTDRTERADPGTAWWVGDRWLTVTSSHRHQGRFRVHLEGIDDRDVAASLTGERILAEPLVDPGDDLWVHEMIGSEVSGPDGRRYGVVTAVEANPAHDILVLDSGGLVPVVFVTGHAPGRLVVDPPAGLLDDGA